MRAKFTILLIIVAFSIQAQDLISTGGDFFQHESGSISFTIGEPIIELVANDHHILTQGFQQATPNTTVYVPEFVDIEVNIYPNPTKDIVHIELSEQISINYELYDLSGVKLIQGDLTPFDNTVNLTGFIPALYILRVFSNEIGIKTFQVVKK